MNNSAKLLTWPKGEKVRKIITAGLIASLALSLTACTNSSSDVSASPTPRTTGTWDVKQTAYLQEIFNAHMSANEVIPGDVYVSMGETVCDGFNQDKKSVELLALLAATADQNGLPKDDRTVFGPTIMAAAITHLCPENLNKVVIE
jgi:hypothetical protein